MNVDSGSSSPGGGRSQDFDLNLAPIIDCFTVLITFMLASAAFLTIGILDTSVASTAPSTDTSQKPAAIRLDLELTTGKELVLHVSGKTKLDKKYPAKDGKWDIGAVKAEIDNLKKTFPDTRSAVLAAADDVEYVHIVKVMEALKTSLPTILLGGF